MADPDKLLIPIESGKYRSMARLPDGSYADRTAIAAGAGLVTDETGRYTFDLGSLASKPTYDAEGNQTSITYGPDLNGRFVRQTSNWGPNNRWMGDSAWQVVDGFPESES